MKSFYIQAENLHSGRNYSTVISARDAADAKAKFRAWDSGFLIESCEEVTLNPITGAWMPVVSKVHVLFNQTAFAPVIRFAITPTTPNYENTEIAFLCRN